MPHAHRQTAEDVHIAAEYAHSGRVPDIARRYGYSSQGLYARLTMPHMKALIARCKLNADARARLVEAQLSINLPAVIDKLTEAATSGDPDREDWATKLYLEAAGLTGNARLHVTGNVAVTTTGDSPAMQKLGVAASKLTSMLEAATAQRGPEVANSPRILVGEAARPHPLGSDSLRSDPKLDPILVELTAK